MERITCNVERETWNVEPDLLSVIPAQAGIQSSSHYTLDSRFHGNGSCSLLYIPRSRLHVLGFTFQDLRSRLHVICFGLLGYCFLSLNLLGYFYRAYSSVGKSAALIKLRSLVRVQVRPPTFKH